MPWGGGNWGAEEWGGLDGGGPSTGGAALPITFAGVATGHPTIHGTAALTITFAGAAAGEVEAVPPLFLWQPETNVLVKPSRTDALPQPSETSLVFI